LEEEPEELNEAPLRKKKKIEYSQILTEKRQLQAELIRVEIYKSKLEALKLERELGVFPSEFTQDIKSSMQTIIVEASDPEFSRNHDEDDVMHYTV
jgi:hypothetical protein